MASLNFRGKKVLISERREESRFRDKRVLILGLGVNQGGVGATKFFVEAGAKVKVTDIKNKDNLVNSLQELQELAGIEYTLGEHKYEDIDWADLIIKNPAIKPDNPYLLYAQKQNKQIEMDMGILLQVVKPSQLIGITGTKGKSTTATLIYEILRGIYTEQSQSARDDKNVLFAGNIGKSVLDMVPLITSKSIVVLELSSFQLEAFATHKVSPHIAVITNIYPDHLNYYGTIEHYIDSKKLIAREQELTDFLVIRKDDPITNSPSFLNGLDGQIVYFSPDDLPANFALKIPGEYNLYNASAALAIAKIYGIAEEKALEVIKNFNGVEYRLQLIKEINGIKIYNDSASTMPQSSILAIQSLPNSILICGGMNKNLDYKAMAETIATDAKMIFFVDGDATDEIKKYLSEIASSQTPQSDVIASKAWQFSQDKIKGTYSDLEKLLTDVKAVARPRDTILFSPGATSFNFFQNEFDRARKFNSAVEKIFG